MNAATWRQLSKRKKIEPTRCVVCCSVRISLARKSNRIFKKSSSVIFLPLLQVIPNEEAKQKLNFS
jgi:hypothetical protein